MKGDTVTSDPFPFDNPVDDDGGREALGIDAPPHVPDPTPAPELSDEERATVDRFEAAPDALAVVLCDCSRLAESHPYDVDEGCTEVPEPEALDPNHEDDGLVDATIVCECERVKGPHDWNVEAGCPPIENVEPGSHPGVGAVVPRNMTLDVDGVLDELADVVTRQTTTAGMKDAVRHTIRVRADERRKAREDRLGDDPVKSATDVRKEFVGASRDAEVLEAIAGVFTAGAKEAKGVVSDTLDELPQRGGKKRASAKVGEDESYELKITRSGATKLSIDDEVLDDVLAAIAIGDAERAHDAILAAGETEGDPLPLGKMPAVTYAAGVRAGVGILRSLLGATPGYKSTALDALVTKIEGRDEDELAKRLRASYGKVATGEPSIKIEHVELKKGADA